MADRDIVFPPPAPPAASHRRLVVAAVLLGLGLGGLFDGIVMHQILQWHHMVSTRTPPDSLKNLEINTLGDGLFHAAAWVLTVTGVFALATANGQRTSSGGGWTLLGGVLLGWGLFNTAEGVMDHYVLGLHHVRPGPDEAFYDVGFLAWGLAMLLVGGLLVRLGRRLVARASDVRD